MAPCEVERSAMLTLADCALEQIPLWLRMYPEDRAVRASTVEDTPETSSDCGGHKSASSVDGDAGRPSKLDKYEASLVVFQVPHLIVHRSEQLAEASGSASPPLPPRIPPLQNRAQRFDFVDLSRIPKVYEWLVRNDTLLHSHFMSECTYPMPNHNEFGKMIRKTCHERKEFLDADKWVKVIEKYRVVCKGCDSAVALDSRNGYYYPNFWVKHRSFCPGIYAIWLRENGMGIDSDKKWFRKHRQSIEDTKAKL
ncbi:uncharacterized protein BT62DRAFT_939228 [Guyanagaster necrorhizus]|uniref:Uncharacterized protein n=1 Tax=Guyanagaster necrorhizus TaxID=856835 RepID=A0A9P8AL21_9AGAR|nr:uncharacterized protein BT62DRAFT_939228 [Guyanagaster necrorhizus MCA 3950]KAG7439161.1 hypothetical protein BT62DRAFT_939228 [Guyanagaster necrorhizus MCA 3950]